MSYLPGLRTSLVEAARHRYTDTAEPQKPRRTPRWLSAGGVASALAAVAAVAVTVLALVTLGHSPARTRTESSPPVTRVELSAAAMRALERLGLPPGAVASGLGRGIPAQLWAPSSQLMIPRRVDVFGIWRLPESPDRVIEFLESHTAAGWSSGFGSDASSSNGGPAVDQQASGAIQLPVVRGIWRQLSLDAVALSGGGTALRVDSEAGWLRPRPATELIPPGVTRVELRLGLGRSGRHETLTITNPARVRALVSALNSLPLGAGRCKSAPNGLIRFAFDGSGGQSPQAIANWAPTCQSLGLAIGGGTTVSLMVGSQDVVPGAQFYGALARLFTPRRVSSSLPTVHSTVRCVTIGHSTSAPSQSAPGAAAASCTSGSSSTKSASAP